jgi:hypothetical protein
VKKPPDEEFVLAVSFLLFIPRDTVTGNRVPAARAVAGALA